MDGMKVFSRPLRTAGLCVLLAASILLCVLFACPALAAKKTRQAQGYTGVLRLWHIDTFEGGTGSRASFLDRAARQFERENTGILVLITPHTAESAERAAREGELPDLLSFGAGVSFAADAALPLQGERAPAGEIGGQTCALPWCRGQYFLFTQEGDFTDVSAANTVVSQGKSTLPMAALYAEGLRGAFPAAEPLRAYTAFLQGKYAYLLGSQRDVYRFAARGVQVRAQPLTEFCDLWQYIAVCTQNAERAAAAAAFIRVLRSPSVQKELLRVGMLAVNAAAYGSEHAAMFAAQKSVPKHTVRAFLTAQQIEQLRDAASAAVNGAENGAKILEKYLAEAL